jgi:hypothetical protein
MNAIHLSNQVIDANEIVMTRYGAEEGNASPVGINLKVSQVTCLAVCL